MKLNLLRLLLACSFLGLVIFPKAIVHADGFAEHFFIQRKDLNPGSITDTIGIAYVNLPDNMIQTYRYSDGRFEPASVMNFFERSTAISACGTYDEVHSGVINYSYPIVALKGDYIEIVYNVSQNFRTWIKKSTGTKRSYFQSETYVVFSLFSDSKFWKEDFNLFIFFFAKKRILYDKPDINSGRSAVESSNGEVYSISRRQGDFVLISVASPDENEPFGWVKIWDENGRLTLWPNCVQWD